MLKRYQPALSMKTSAAAIEDAIDVCVLCFALGAGLGAAADTQERIIEQVGRGRGGQRFQACGGLTPVRQQDPFAFGDAAQHTFGILPKFEHGHGFHVVEVYVELEVLSMLERSTMISSTSLSDATQTFPLARLCSFNGPWFW